MPDTVLCVAALVMKGERVLLVRQAEGHPLAGQWTIPWGRVDQGESAAKAALRETLEKFISVVAANSEQGMRRSARPF